MDMRNLMQYSSLVVVIATLVFGIMWARRVITRILWFVPVATWLTHTIVFYVSTIIWLDGKLPHIISFTDWSAFLRLHGYVTVFMIIFALNRLNGKVDGHHDTPRLI